MKKNNVKKAAIGLVVIAGLYFWSFYFAHLMVAFGGSPMSETRALDKYRKLPSEVIIRELRFHADPFYDPYHAFMVLGERKEKTAVPEIARFLRSRRSYYRQEATYALAEIDDPRAIGPLMEIVKKGQKHPSYFDALWALSRMKSEEAYPYVIEYAKAENASRNGSVAMLEKYGKTEDIPILLGIKEGIKDSDPWARHSRDEIGKAIEHIKSAQK